MKKLISFLLVLFSTFSLFAQTVSSIPIITENLHSDIVGMDYKLKISLPLEFNPEKKTYPVLYYLDAWGTSGGMNEMVKTKMFLHEIEEVVMVGISYEANPATHVQIRTRDYSLPLHEMDTLKGGEKFYHFITSELIPYMEKKYATDPNDRGLLGSSLSGLFTAWTLKQETLIFNRYAILSPSLWYGGDEFLLKNADFLKNLAHSEGLRIFISYGSLEPKRGHILKGEKLFELISQNEKNHVQKVIFQDETHGSVWYGATSRALTYLYQSEYSLLINEGMSYFKVDAFDKALARFELAFSSDPDAADDGDRYDFACLYALNGDSKNAFKYLETMKDSKRNWYNHMLKDSDLNSLHGEDEWDDLLKALKKKEKKK